MRRQSCSSVMTRWASRLQTREMRERELRSLIAACFRMSVKSSAGRKAIGHGGAGSASVGGGAPGMDRVEKLDMSCSRVDEGAFGC